jgi:hypothetical protein
MQTDREQLTADIERELSRVFENAPLIASLRGQHWALTTRTRGVREVGYPPRTRSCRYDAGKAHGEKSQEREVKQP